MNEKTKSKIVSVIGYIVVMGITLAFGSYAISLIVQRATEEAKDFERGYYEGYEQGLNEDYWTGWSDCRRYFEEYPEKLLK